MHTPCNSKLFTKMDIKVWKVKIWSISESRGFKKGLSQDVILLQVFCKGAISILRFSLYFLKDLSFAMLHLFSRLAFFRAIRLHDAFYHCQSYCIKEEERSTCNHILEKWHELMSSPNKLTSSAYHTKQWITRK